MQAPWQSFSRSPAGMPHAAGPASLSVVAPAVGEEGIVKETTEVIPVLVFWADSTLQEGWGRYIEGISPDCITVGHLFRETDDVVVVALSRTELYYGSFITIPRGAVQSIVRLVPGQEPAQQETCVRKRRPSRTRTRPRN